MIGRSLVYGRFGGRRRPCQHADVADCGGVASIELCGEIFRGENVGQTTIALQGSGPDDLHIHVKLTMDLSDIRTHNSPQTGRGLILDYTIQTDMSRYKLLPQQLPPSLYDKASSTLLTVEGRAFTAARSFAIMDQVPDHLNTTSLFIPLSDADIETLEDHRRESDLHLPVILSGLVQIAGSPQEFSKPLYFIPTTTVRVDSSIHYITIPREPWVKALNHWGRIRHLIELPEPDIPLQSPWAPVTAKYQLAIQAHRDGRYEDATGMCRKVMEGIMDVLTTQWNIVLPDATKPQAMTNKFKELQNRLKKTAGSSSEERDQADAFGALLLTVWKWSSSTHHFSNQLPQRDGARFTLFLTMSLMDLAAQVLKAHPKPLKDSESKDEQS